MVKPSKRKRLRVAKMFDRWESIASELDQLEHEEHELQSKLKKEGVEDPYDPPEWLYEALEEYAEAEG